MRRRPVPAIVALAGALALVASSAGPAAADPPDRGPRIVNSEGSGPIPYQAYVVGQQSCGGTVVDALHVVTAGHCFTDLGSAAAVTQVYAGMVTIPTPEATTQVRNVVRVSRHPGFALGGAGEKINDAAVLTLSSPLTLGGAVQPLALTATGVDDTGRQARVSGWGDTDGSAPYTLSPTLQYTTVTVLPDSNCAVYPAYSAANMLCALGSGSPPNDACVGDSGGPLARLGAGGQPEALIGIVSYGGATCGDNTHPGVYTRVAAPGIRSFIDSALTPVAGAVSVSGTASVGGVLSCNPSGWEGATAFAYQWLRNGAAIAGATGATYTVAAADAGQAVSCRATGTNGALAATADSAPVTPTAAPAQPGPGPLPGVNALQTDTTRPTSRITRGKCTPVKCTLTITVRDTGFTSGLPTLRFTLQRRSGCPKGKRGSKCRRTRKITAHRLSGGRFRVTLRHLARAKYRATAVATDHAGHRQKKATRLTFQVKRR
jgi:hypothetical protein